MSPGHGRAGAVTCRGSRSSAEARTPRSRASRLLCASSRVNRSVAMVMFARFDYAGDTGRYAVAATAPAGSAEAASAGQNSDRR